MSEKDPQSAWLDAWATAQKDLWQRFLGGQPASAPEPAAGPAMFAQLFGQGLPDSSRDLTRKMMEFGEGYLGVAREFWKLVQAMPAGATDAAKLQRELQSLQSGFTESFSRLYASGPLGGDLLDAWQRMGAAAGAGGQGPAWPGLPALGPLRERQEAMERLGRAALKYQQALGRFGQLLSRVSGDAVERLAKRVTRRVESDEPIGSLRAMYDLWVDAGEEAYAAAAHGREFAQAQAELNDALMDLKAEQRAQVEEWARALDLPTRTEINTILKRLNTLKRRVRELEEELDTKRQAKRS